MTQVTSFDTLSQKMVQSSAYSIYSADGLLLEEQTGSGMLTKKNVYTYDDNGILLTMENYSGKTLDYTSYFEYDSEGRLIREYAINKHDDQIWEKTYVIEEL